MRVTAIVGDVHGYHHRMISILYAMEKKKGYTIDRILQVGDFEAHRHEADLATMAAPQKYRILGDFHDYYEGSQAFPWPIYFIGGNHEPYGWYDQHVDGVRLTENCHYLGRVGRTEIDGLQVVGLSGIYHPEKFTRPRPAIELIEYRSKKDYINYTETEIELALGYDRCDILLLHDWPQGIISDGDVESLRGKRRSKNPREIGNEFTFMLVEALRPKVVACGHMHYKYRNTLNLQSDIIEVCCVGNVESGSDAVIFLDEALNVLS